MVDSCIFCKIAQGMVASDKIYENEKFFSIFDINPALEGHALVISKEHFETFFDLPASYGEMLLDCINNTFQKLKIDYSMDGGNVIANIQSAGGQIIPHFHIHLFPRKIADNAILKFVDKDTGKSVELKDRNKD